MVTPRNSTRRETIVVSIRHETQSVIRDHSLWQAASIISSGCRKTQSHPKHLKNMAASSLVCQSDSDGAGTTAKAETPQFGHTKSIERSKTGAVFSMRYLTIQTRKLECSFHYPLSVGGRAHFSFSYLKPPVFTRVFGYRSAATAQPPRSSSDTLGAGPRRCGPPPAREGSV